MGHRKWLSVRRGLSWVRELWQEWQPFWFTIVAILILVAICSYVASIQGPIVD
jgi:hypothetical protein